MSKSVIYEIYWLRAISCLSVVLIHAITSGVNFYDFNISAVTEKTLLLIQLFLMFATPSFIFMSEFLLARSYPNGLPNGFFKKRVKFLLVPYLFMALVYALVFVEQFTLLNVIKLTIRHAVLGDFVAYFVLIIFQFYILHYLLHNKLAKYNPAKVLILSFLINAFYLGFFVITSSPVEGGLIEYFWGKGRWMFFPAWFFYFTLGYYAGRNYNKLLDMLERHKAIVVIMPLVTFFFSIVMTEIGFPITSKRIDIIFHTTAIIFLVLLVTYKLKEPPKFVLFISQYSFGIYLLHKLVVDTVGPISNNIFIHIISLFILGLVFSITVMFIFNKIPYGKYVTGQIGKIKIDNKQLRPGA